MVLGPSGYTWALITQLLFTCETWHPPDPAPAACAARVRRPGQCVPLLAPGRASAAAPGHPALLFSLTCFHFTLRHLRGDPSKTPSCADVPSLVKAPHALCLETTKCLCSRSSASEGGPKKPNLAEPLLDARHFSETSWSARPLADPLNAVFSALVL